MPTGPGARPSRGLSAPGLSVPYTRSPPLAKVSYACAMSSGDTPCFRPPSVIAQLVETLLRMPMRSASRAILRVPILMPTWANTELSEKVVARPSVVMPE